MKYLTLLLFLFIGSATFAQFGVEASYGLGKAKIEINGSSVEDSSNVISFGLVYDLE